jgi:hypothetical protein
MPAPGLTLPVPVQILIADGSGSECWQATFTAPTNTRSRFRSKGPEDLERALPGPPRAR